MTSLDSILVTTDFSDEAHNAVRQAAFIAARHKSRLTLLHVVDPSLLKGPRSWFSPPCTIEQKLAVAHAALGRIAADLTEQHDLRVSAEVLVGRPLELVCRKAEKFDLLVIGSRHTNLLKSLIFGTAAEQILRLVRRPVLVVRQATQTHYERVLIAVDLDMAPQSMLHSARAFAPEASLHVIHALGSQRMGRMLASDVPSAVIREVGDGERQRGRTRILSMLASIGLNGVQVSVAHGDAPQLTVQRQQEIAADLIVLGKDGPSAMCNFLLGSVPQRVLSTASCDVLVVPKPAPRGNAGKASPGTWLSAGPRKALERVDALSETATAMTPRRHGSAADAERRTHSDVQVA